MPQGQRQRRSIGFHRPPAVAEMVRLFVLPPLLTLALVAATLLLFSHYHSDRSLRTTYLYAEVLRARSCTFCHSGFFAGSWRRVAALSVRVSDP